jgi:eukaryotic-like serine/threonine-protein kinase
LKIASPPTVLKLSRTLSWRLLLRVLAVLTLLVAAVWMIADPDPEKLLTLLGAITALLASPSVSDKPITSTLTSHPSEELESRTRKAMLERVEGYWVKGVLEQSLHSVGLLDLGMTEDATAVEHPWEMSVFTPSQTRTPLPPGEKIIHLFDSSNRALLLLGEPGSGKTTMLIEFARDLIAIAKNDSKQAIPVVLNLSSWAERGGPLNEWIIEELRTKYYINHQVTRAWIEKEAFILLLDGLDEVRDELRAECVKAINEFRQKYGLTGILVTSRLQDYERLEPHLQLQRALVIEPLSQEQVDRYLEKGGTALAALRQCLRDNPVLRELSHTPLMFSIMALAYKDKSLEEIGQLKSSGEYARHIFHAYVNQMFRRKATASRAPDKVLTWLAWLAKTLHEHNASVFQIEGLQPSVIPSRIWRWFYYLTTRLASGAVMALSITLFWILYLVQDSSSVVGLANNLLNNGKTVIPVFCLTIGLVTGSVDFARSFGNKIQPVRRLPGFICHILRVLLIALLHVGATGLVFWILVQKGFSSADLSDTDPELFAMVVAVTGGLGIGLIAGVMYGLRESQEDATADIKTVEALSWSWHGAFRKGLLGALTGAVAAFLLVFFIVLTFLLADKFGWFSSTMLFESTQGGWVYGLREIIQSTWSLTIELASLLAPVCMLFGSVLGGLSGYAIEKKTAPNQGVKLSIKSAIVAGLAVTAGGAIIATLAFSRILPDLRLVDSLLAGTVAGAGCGLLAFLWYGGIDSIHHYTLRYVLYFNGCLPLHIVRFLDHANRTILVHKVGGGYIFIHRLLMEYFVELHHDPAKLQDLQKAVTALRT